MQVTGKLQFESSEHREIYEYVERHGSVGPDDIADHVGMGRDELDGELAALQDAGYLEERDGHLRVALDTGAEETYSTAEFEFTVRPAQEDDMTGLVGTIRSVAEEQTYIEAETIAGVLDQEGVLLRHNELESRVFFVACVGNEVVGWCHIGTHEIEKLNHTAELTVGVLDAYRGFGIGGRLLGRGVRWAEENGYERLYQSLPATNQEAIRFLEANGWVTEAIRKYHYKIDGEYVAEQMMAIML
jgi:GNAT superfamily N-acetyltransferase